MSAWRMDSQAGLISCLEHGRTQHISEQNQGHTASVNAQNLPACLGCTNTDDKVKAADIPVHQPLSAAQRLVNRDITAEEV